MIALADPALVTVNFQQTSNLWPCGHMTCVVRIASQSMVPQANAPTCVHVKYDARAMQWLGAAYRSLSNTGCQLRSTSERERETAGAALSSSLGRQPTKFH
jgi:hypothetical protein